MRRARVAILLLTPLACVLGGCPSLDDLLAPSSLTVPDAAPDVAGPSDATAPGDDSGSDASDRDLVAAWDFEGIGTTAEDVTGHGHALLLVGGATQEDGGVDGGGALVVHGFDLARAESLARSAFPRTGTVAMFFQHAPDGGIGNLFDGHDVTVSHIFIRRVATPGAVQVALQLDGGYVFESTFGTNPGAWNHVAVTWEEDAGDGGIARSYVNGVRFRTRDYAGVPFVPDGQRVNLGSGFTGRIDRVRLYRRALTDDEIEALARP